jgi:hypothetical protein
MTTQTVYGIVRKHGIDVLSLVLSIVMDGMTPCSISSEMEKGIDRIGGISSMNDYDDRCHECTLHQ